jgi:Fic family protein
MLSRTRDGTGQTAPRELIHLLSSLRESQLRRFELGHDSPPAELLFDRAAFKEALPDVSKVRLEQTLYAENASLKPYLEQLDQQKTQQTVGTLARAWELPEAQSRALADQLTEIGFFERRGERDRYTYWVPFLYRDALRMVQGSADPASDPDAE